jgi:uncharacterized delta-60 repeat protein
MKILLRLALSGIIFSASILSARTASGQAGALDLTFGNGGTTITNFGSSGIGLIDALQVQSNGDILVLVVAGANNEVARYTSTGALDPTFGNNGIAVLSPSLGSMTQQPNGQIVLAGTVSNSTGNFLAVSRLNTNGTQDTTFGTGGVGLASLGNRGTNVGEAVLVQTNGKIIVCQTLEPTGRRQPFQTMLARFTSTGQLDTTFGTGGTVVATGAEGCTAIAELSDGSYLIANSQAVAQFAANGSVVSPIVGGTVVTFNPTSAVFTPSVFQSNGDFLVGEDVFVGEESRGHDSSVEVLRFTETGAADPSFTDTSFHFVGAGGPDIEALVSALAVAPNGDIAVAGDQIMFSRNGNTIVNGLARLTSSGVLDTTFGNGGIVANNNPASAGGFSSVAVQSDGKIVVAGITNNELFLSRYLGQ